MEIALAVGGALLSPAFQVLFDRFTSMDLLNYARQGRVLDELKKWERMLKKIYAVLDDAEEKQITNQAIKIWVSELRDLAYDIEDILDEFDTEARRQKLMAAPMPSTSSKVWKFIPNCCVGVNPTSIKFNVETISKMEKVTARLDEIMKEKECLHLEEGARGKTVGQGRERSATTSLLNEAQVYGRENDKNAILQLMTAETSSSELSVIPIVGMGGIGKTTLAQLVFNDTSLKFDFKAWVSVGDIFDVSRITKTILQLKDCDGDDLNSLQVKLKDKLSGNKFLIVLDDVWTENYDDWTLFRGPFEAGAPGSRIIITTRSEGVSLKIGTTPAYHLQKLSYDDCSSVFVYHALGTRSFDNHLELKEIGEAIANKCQGLPLAAKTLGGLLRGKRNPNIWIEVLKSKIWDLPEDSGILPALRLSYHHLPSHLKRCFAYCAIFPKDFIFHGSELVVLWMAEGLLQQTKTKKKIEAIGFEYMNELLSRSFFEERGDGSFVMHDLVSDLARFVSGDTLFDPVDDLGDGHPLTGFNNVRHSTFLPQNSRILQMLFEMKHLRTVVITSGWAAGEFTDMELYNLVLELKRLRVLCLQIAWITQLPSSIGQLTHLRLLDMHGTKIKYLPESVGALLNLQTLILNQCEELTALPKGIKNLTNLRYLDIISTPSLQEMPAGLGNLRNLQGLAKFIVGKGDGLKLSELKELLELHGKLSIQRIHNLMDPEDAKLANLKDKLGLDELEMEWTDDFNDSRNERNETLVLDLLQPPKNLEKLTIAFFGGTKFPMWLGDQSLGNLSELDLTDCRNCESLPSLGQLPFLRRLFIDGTDRLRTVGVEFYGNESFSPKPFRSLEILQITNMINWEHWTCSDICFPCLVQLGLQNCPKLMGELPRYLPSLEHLLIAACPQLKGPLVSLPSVHTLHIEQSNQALLGRIFSVRSLTWLQLCSISGLGCLNKWLMRAMPMLKVLKVEDCTDLSLLWENGGDVQRLASLKRVVIKKCPNLEMFAVGDKGLPCNVEFLVLEECEKLETLPNDLHSLTYLADLRIKSCPKLKFPATGLPQALTYLRFGDPHEVKEIMTKGEINETSEYAYNPFAVGVYKPSQDEGKMHINISDSWQLESLLRSMVCNNIKHILVPACLNLKCLGECKHNLVHLKGLTISGCRTEKPSPLSEWGLSSLSSLECLEISRVEMVSFPDGGGCLLPLSLKRLSVNVIDHLKSISRGILDLTSLEQLEINNCNEVSSLPKEGLPVSLQRLDISYCPLLEKRCENKKGEYWPIIANIPNTQIINDENNPNGCTIQ